MNHLNIEAVIFDFDGTLVDLNIDFDTMRRAVEALLPEYDLGPHEWKGLYILEMINGVTARISSRNSLDGDSFYKRSHELITRHEVEAARDGSLFPGVIPMLEGLESIGLKIGIITRNCRAAVTEVFPKIDTYCDVFIPRDDVTFVKPHPEHLTQAMVQMNLGTGERCLMVGDHVIDIDAGRELNMRTAGVLTGNTTREGFLKAGADYVFNVATEILDCLKGE